MAKPSRIQIAKSKKKAAAKPAAKKPVKKVAGKPAAKPVARKAVKKITAPVKKATKATKPVSKPLAKKTLVKKTGSAKPVAKKILTRAEIKKASLKKPAAVKTVNPALRKSGKLGVPQRTSKVVPENLVPKHKKNDDAPKKKAQTTKFYTEQQVLDKLKEHFPELSRKRVIENIVLTAKQLKKLAKLPKLCARIPASIKRTIGIVDESTKQAEEDEKKARTRVIDTEKAKDTQGTLEAFEAAKAARGDTQTSKIIKAVQLRMNKRLMGIYGNYVKINTQLNNFTSVALDRVAAEYAGVDTYLESRVRSAVKSVSSIFKTTEENEYDFFEYAGSKLDMDPNAALDPEMQFVDEDKEDTGSPSILPPSQVHAAEAPAYDDNADMFGDTPSGSDDSTVDSGKTGRKRVNAIKTMGKTRIRYAERAYMAHRCPETMSLFSGSKRNAFVGFTMGALDKQGNFSTSSTSQDSAGNVSRNAEPNHVLSGDSELPFHSNSKLFESFIKNLGSLVGMRTTTNVGLVHVCSRQAISFLKIHGFSTNYRVLIRNNLDNTGRYGIIISVAAGSGMGSKVLVIPFGLLGISHKEITTLCQGDFQEIPDKLFEYVSYSILTNGLMAQGKVFGFSKKERSLLAPPKKTGEPAQDKIMKLANGHIYYLPDIDRRNEFALYRESIKLPEKLDDTLIGDDGKTDYDKYVGAIVYTDMKENIAFYYTKDGRLSSTMFNGACDLNARDCADMMKDTPTVKGIEALSYDPTNADHRKNMSPYGTTTLLPIRYLGADGNSKLNARPIPTGFPGYYGAAHIRVALEDLRTSFQSEDKIYYTCVKEAIENHVDATESKIDRDAQSNAGNGYTLVSLGEGLTDCDWNTASKQEKGRKDHLTGRDVTSIKIMLHIAAKTTAEWPGVDVWQARAEDARVKPPTQEDLHDVVGMFNGLEKNKSGEYPTAMPHQAYILRTLQHQDVAALDCDMGGGKTFMSCADSTNWIKTGVHGAPARPCILMPTSLISNYMDDVKNNFFGKNLNFFVLSSSTNGWAKMDNTKIADIARRCPANTLFVASYEWLGLSKYPVITGTKLATRTLKVAGEKNRKILLEIPESTDVFPNAQLLLDIGINVLYLDESHMIKNSSSGCHKSVQTLSGIPVKRIMTGTMVTRDVDDVFTQTSFIDGTMIGTRRRFQAMYCEEGKATEIKKGLEKKVRTHLMASGVMQVRRSMWLGLLPKKAEHFEFVELEGLHGAVYDILMNDIDEDADDMVKIAKTFYLKDPTLLQEALQWRQIVKYGQNSDTDNDANTKELERIRIEASDDVDTDDAVTEGNAGRSKDGKLSQFYDKKRGMGEKISMLQSFISSPQSLNPAKFSSKAQEQLKSLNAALPEHTGKDLRIIELIAKHWSMTGGMYKAPSEQRKDNLSGTDSTAMMRGKIIIFAENVSTVEHVYAFLKKSKYAHLVVRYTKQDSKATDNLDDFKNAENTDAAIIVAAEKSVIFGQNMQAADMMIKLTIPWTTGNYDQAVARIFRNGQKLACEIFNIVAVGTFEVAKLAKFLIRQNSNRKLISDYSNPFNMNHALGELNSGGVADSLKTEQDMRNFSYTDHDSGNRVNLDLIAVHQSVYDHEIVEAQQYIKLFADAGYGDPNTDRIEVSSGKSVIDADDASMRPVDPDGNVCVPGQFKLADLAYFDGENVVNARDINRKSLSADIKRQRDMELAQELGVDSVDALNLKGAGALLNQYMKRALSEVLKQHPAFAKFIPGESTRGFNLFLGQALRDGDFRLLAVKTLSFNNFAEKAGNDLNDPEVRAELMTLSRLVYNKVISNYPGCVAIDDDVQVKYDKKGTAIDVIGHDEKKDHSLVKKNARIISSIVGKGDITVDEPTPTKKALDESRQKAQREVEVVKETKTKRIREAVEEEPEELVGINLGISELVVVSDDYEGSGSKNVSTNDSVYIFAPAGANDPKQLKRLAKVNVGVGRSTTTFTKKTMWVFNRPVTDMKQVVSIALAIENAGGYVEKVGKGTSQKYAITTDDAANALFRVKAPVNFAKIDSYGGGIQEHVATAVAAKPSVRKSEVELGLYLFDRRILVVAESKDESLLRQAGFKRLDMLRCDFDRSPKLQAQLETVFSRIRKAGINILNSEIVSRRLKVIAGKPIQV